MRKCKNGASAVFCDYLLLAGAKIVCTSRNEKLKFCDYLLLAGAKINETDLRYHQCFAITYFLQVLKYQILLSRNTF